MQKRIQDAAGKVKLHISIKDQDWVLIEGDGTSLEFLGNLFLSCAGSDDPTWRVLNGDPPMFLTGSLGIYVHRIPDSPAPDSGDP